MAQREKDPISREAYRSMYHAVQEELRALKQALRDGTAYEDDLWSEGEASMGEAVGYYRMGKSLNGHYWVRFKWTQGPLAGRYAIGGHNTLRNAFCACQSEIDACLSGKKMPPLDKGYAAKGK